jgi:hypothetical protein
MWLLAAVLVSTAALAGPDKVFTRYVNCDRGRSLDHVIELADRRSGQLNVYVRGTCNETVTIRRSRTWIYGVDDAVIHGRVNVFEASNVRFFDIEITGPDFGLLVSGGADVIADNLTLSGNDIANLRLARNASAWLRESNIAGDCDDIYDEDCADGVSVSTSVLTVRNSTISGNRYGITADNTSTVTLLNTQIDKNSVVGVQAALQSNVDLLGGTGFNGNRYHSLYLLQGSVARVSSPEVYVGGNIGCQDWRSYIANPGGGYIGSTWCEIL